MNKKIIIIATIILALAFGGYYVFAKDEAPKQSTRDAYIAKWADIGALKYEETEATKKAQEAKEKKDKLLQELQGSGFTK